MPSATFTDILSAVQSTIRGLSLEGIDSDEIQVRKQPWHRKLALPGVLITPVEEILPADGGTNARNDIGYGVRITLVQAGNQSPDTNLDRLLRWREQVVRAFQAKRLAGVTPSIVCRIEPGLVFEPIAADRQYDVSALVIRCFTREART